MVNMFNKDMHSNFSTLGDIRRDMVEEIEAIIQYDEHIQRTSDVATRRMLEEIRNEELVHLGNLLALSNYLYPNQKQYIEQGIREFNMTLTGQNPNPAPNPNPNQTTPLM